MSVRELIYRLRESLKKKIDKSRKTGYFPKGSIDSLPKQILHLPENKKFFPTGLYSIFGNELNFDKTINWHKDILNGKEFPMDFSFSIDTRSGKNGNVKVVWEINRLQFLSEICLKYHQTKELKYLNQFISIITSWKEANPYLKGVNWYSNIEVNIRIINWFMCWEILQVNELIKHNAEFKQFVENIWFPLIELHGKHAFRYESKFSSSNNHLIAEASGLFIAGSYWSFSNSSRWADKGKKLLEFEIQQQHSKNGINKEEASEYIQFITDFFLIAYIVGERTNNKFSPSYTKKLHQIFSYIFNLMDISGHVPYYGDDDDGKVISLLFEKGRNNFQSLLTTAAILFNESSFKSKGKVFDLKNEILFGQKGRDLFNNLEVIPEKFETKFHEKDGHFIIKKGDEKNEIYLHIDIAPLGYLSIAAHGHADALSFFLNIDGKPYIIDPGTYTYHSYPEWRAYFKGTLAHNTIRVDGIDQATNGGPCLWLDHYETTCLGVINEQRNISVKGSHSGFKKLGVTHVRSYIFNKIDDIIIINDEIITSSDKPHIYEIPFHLHPDIEYTQQSKNKFEIAHSTKRKVQIILDKQLTSEIVTGSTEPLLGWFSPSFLQKQPTSVIYGKVELAGNFSLKTEIHIKRD